MGTLSEYSVLLDGSNEHVLVGNVAALDFDRLTTWSVSAWILPLSTGSYCMCSKMQGSTTFRGWMFRVSNRRLYVTFSSDWGAGDRLEVHTTDAVIPIGGWTHAVLTMDGTGTAAGVKLYVNAVEVTAKTTIYDALTATTVGTANAAIGARLGVPDQYFNGYLDEVAAYNKTLSGAEVATIFGSGDPPDLTSSGPTANLVGYWKIGDGDTYPTATDSSSSGNNGTYTNTESADINFGGAGPVVIGDPGIPADVLSGGDVLFQGERVFGDTGLLGGSSAVTLYKMRGRDDGVPAPGYVSWNSDFPDFLGVNSGGSVPPIVGSLIPGSVVEVSSWTE